MAQNRIQFQPGMSMPEFIAQYGTEEQCATALERVRCPRCGSAAHGVIQDDRAKRFQCKICRHSTCSGPMKWFWSCYIFLCRQVQRKLKPLDKSIETDHHILSSCTLVVTVFQLATDPKTARRLMSSGMRIIRRDHIDPHQKR